MKGWFTLARSIRNEIPHLLQFSAWEPSSLLCLVSLPHITLRAPPPTTCFFYSLSWLPLIALFHFISSFLYHSLVCVSFAPFFLPPFYLMCLISPFLMLYLSFSLVILDQYSLHSPSLHLSPSLTASFVLSPSRISACVARQAYRRAPLSLSAPLSPGQAAVMRPNALLIPATSQNIPADAHMGTLTCRRTRTHTDPTGLTLILLCAPKYTYKHVYVIVCSHLQACRVRRANTWKGRLKGLKTHTHTHTHSLWQR